MVAVACRSTCFCCRYAVSAMVCGHSPRASQRWHWVSPVARRSLVACSQPGASWRASSRARPKSGLILRTMPISGVWANTCSKIQTQPDIGKRIHRSPQRSRLTASPPYRAGGLVFNDLWPPIRRAVRIMGTAGIESRCRQHQDGKDRHRGNATDPAGVGSDFQSWPLR